MAEDKLMIFIDGANIFKSCSQYRNKEGERIRIDYLKLIKELKGDMKLIRPYFFDAVPEARADKKSSFLDMLRANGVNVITKFLKYKTIRCENCVMGLKLLEIDARIKLPNLIGGKSVILRQEYQKGVDVALVTELLRMAREDGYDLAIVVSGDNDYSSAIDYIKQTGRRVWVASFRKSLGADIKQSADKVIFLDDISDKIEFEEKELE